MWADLSFIYNILMFGMCGLMSIWQSQQLYLTFCVSPASSVATLPVVTFCETFPFPKLWISQAERTLTSNVWSIFPPARAFARVFLGGRHACRFF